MSARFMKVVKSARRGKKLANKLKKQFLLVVLLFVALVFGSAYVVWTQEEQGHGSFLNALWSVLFTLIGQGEFASNPRTPVGRVIVFVLSIVGVAVLGVILSELMQRLMTSKLREMMGMSRCKYEGHSIICGWNERGRLILRELLATGKQASVIASERPVDLPNGDVFFVAGSPTDEDVLLRAGIMGASAAIILANRTKGADDVDIDAKNILVALAVESLNPPIYSVIELINPDNERHARLAKVDDIIYCDSLIAEITATCAVNSGISVFMRDILCASDQGHRFVSFPVDESFSGRTIGELFDEVRGEQGLPVGVVVPPDDEPDAPVSSWHSLINPDAAQKIVLPMKVVCIVKNQA